MDLPWPGGNTAGKLQNLNVGTKKPLKAAKACLSASGMGSPRGGTRVPCEFSQGQEGERCRPHTGIGAFVYFLSKSFSRAKPPLWRETC